MRPARWLPKAIVAAVFGAFAAYALLFRVTMPGATGNSNESTVLLGTLEGSNTGGSAVNARSLALHGMPQPPERMIVVARTTQETGWIHLQFGDIPVAVYQAVANLTGHRARCPQGQRQEWAADCCTYAFHDVGREAGAYLQFIEDFWDSLPSSMLFLHAHNASWHRDTQLLNKLRWGAVEFANVRHWGFTNWDCEPVGKPCYMLGTYTTPQNDSAAADPNLNPKQGWGIAEWFSRSVAHCWEPIFQAEMGPMPEGVHPPACCAEFLVTAKRVQMRPRSFYTKALGFMQTPQGARLSGDIAVAFEQLWHHAFGEPVVMHAASKCDMYYCSEEEKADPTLVAAPVTKPYRNPHMASTESQQ